LAISTTVVELLLGVAVLKLELPMQHEQGGVRVRF